LISLLKEVSNSNNSSPTSGLLNFSIIVGEIKTRNKPVAG